MKNAILINTESKSIEEIQWDEEIEGNYEVFKRHMKCVNIEQLRFDDISDMLLLDENGIEKKGNLAFRLGNTNFYGNAIIHGLTPSNEVADGAETPIALLRTLVTFFDIETTENIKSGLDTNWHFRMKIGE